MLQTGHQFGKLEKHWLDEHNLVTGELFAFGDCIIQETFQADVKQILIEDQERPKNEKLDHFLAVIDVVKEHALQAELERKNCLPGQHLVDGGYGSMRVLDWLSGKQRANTRKSAFALLAAA